jgi:LPXTG-site transpeptidase (sortase) family protein
MFKFQIFLMLVGSLLIGLGLTISVGAAFTGISETPTVSPFDQTDDIIGSPDGGFAPLIIPTSGVNMPDPTTDQVQSASPVISGQDLAASILSLTGTPEPVWVPDRLLIPAIHLDASVVQGKLRTIDYQGKLYPQWKAPNSFAVGWNPTSAPLGTTGNTVLFGHHNVHGEVFAHLVDLEVNDVVVLYSGERKFAYIVALKMILQERYKPLYVRLENARWILPSLDERITILTCWPYTSNTHRLVIVAVPINVNHLQNFPRISEATPTTHP